MRDVAYGAVVVLMLLWLAALTFDMVVGVVLAGVRQRRYELERMRLERERARLEAELDQMNAAPRRRKRQGLRLM